ncbi:uncharacterized protein BDZ99DRAFT_497360, partial [Mytilinidion resinicola]
ALPHPPRHKHHPRPARHRRHHRLHLHPRAPRNPYLPPFRLLQLAHSRTTHPSNQQPQLQLRLQPPRRRRHRQPPPHPPRHHPLHGAGRGRDRAREREERARHRDRAGDLLDSSCGILGCESGRGRVDCAWGQVLACGAWERRGGEFASSKQDGDGWKGKRGREGVRRGVGRADALVG